MATSRKQDDIALLAWIDFCKKQKVEPKKDVLNFAVNHHRFSNRDAVEKHLSELWRKYSNQSEDPDQTMSLVDMLSKGSSYMTKLPGEMHAGVRARVDDHIGNVTSLHITEMMKRNMGQKEATSHTKSQVLTEEENRGVKRSKQPEKSEESLPLSKKARSSRVESSAKVIEESAASGVEKSRLPPSMPMTTLTEAADKVVNCNGKKLLEAKTQAPPDQSGRTTNEDRWTKHLRSLENKHSQEIAHLQELWQAEVESLSIKEAEAQRTIRDLKAQVKHLNEARKARQEGERQSHGEDANISLETRQFEDLEEIYRLTKENREMQKFAAFADLNLPGNLHLGHDTIDEAMDQIQFELSSISYHRSSSPRLFHKLFAISGDLRSLILSAFGSDIQTAGGRDDVETIIKKFDAQICIRALVLAAVRDWVFMSRFPNFAPSNPRILSNYRHIISGLDGKDRLYSLDMAAHRAIIEGKWFKEESIPRRATDFAARFSNAVAPLFTNTSGSVEERLFHTWGENPECWKDRRAHLQEIFQAALSLKADSVVTKSRYEFAIYPLGTTFVEDATDGKDIGRTKSGSSWIHASFHIHDAMIVGNPKDIALVQTENFVRVSGSRASAKYSKVLLFPKRSTELVPSIITEFTDKSSPQCTDAVHPIKDLGSNPTRMAMGVEHNEVGEVASNSTETDETTNSEQSKTPPLPNCNKCGEVFPALALLRRHEKNKSCTKCPDCGKRFGRSKGLHKHQALEHAEYRQANQKININHEEVMADVAKGFGASSQRVEQDSQSQVTMVPRVESTANPPTITAETRQETTQEEVESSPADSRPKCNRCGRSFSQGMSLSRHLKTKVCSLDCLECHKSFQSATERRRHQRDEHPKFCKLVENDSEVTTESQAEHNDHTQEKPVETGPNVADTESFEDVSRQQEPRNSLVEDRTPRCEHCGSSFVAQQGLDRHLEKGVCDINCKQCNIKFDTVQERRRHQRSTHGPRKQSYTEPLVASATVNAETPLASPEPQTPKSSTHAKTLPSSCSAQSLDRNGKHRYRKTPRREIEESDADDMLSPSEMAKTKRTQRRRSTRSSDGLERRTFNQESPVRPNGKSKPLVIEE